MSWRRPLVIDELMRLGKMQQAMRATLNPTVCDDATTYLLEVEDADPSAANRLIAGMRVRPPYDATWLELVHEATSGNSVAVWVTGSPLDGAMRAYDALAATMHTVVPGQRCLVGPNALLIIAYWCGPQLSTGHHSISLVPCDSEWRVGERSWLHRTVPGIPPGGRGLVTLALFALGLFHVRNAEFRPFGNRAARRARSPVSHSVVVRELVIEPMKQAVRAIRRWRRTHPGQPIPHHLRRGHFKTFEDQDGHRFMGKRAGTWWWDPEFRGDKGNGEIRHPLARLKL